MSLETFSQKEESGLTSQENTFKFNRYSLKENLAKTEAYADTLVKAYLSKK